MISKIQKWANSVNFTDDSPILQQTQIWKIQMTVMLLFLVMKIVVSLKANYRIIKKIASLIQAHTMCNKEIKTKRIIFRTTRLK